MVADDGGKQAESSDLVGSAVVGPLAARDYKGVGNQYVDENKLVVDGTASRVESTMQVRRLTPIECERLMGWPDNHTLIGTDGPIPVSQRFKMCGNGVASPVATWLGKHIMGEQ
jgi:site-specific DNA-cytosine methylase